MNAPSKRKAPAPAKTQGACDKQISFLPPPPLSPTTPSLHSKAWLALHDMVQGPITQIDWLNLGRGWRLGAAVKELDYLGWVIGSEWVQNAGWPRPIKRYFLPPDGLRLAIETLEKRQGGAA